MNLPADMNDAGAAKRLNAKAVVSIRDLLVLLGASDQELQDCDDRAEILAREPWRRDELKWRELGKTDGGISVGVVDGSVDWSGTRFEGK